MLYRITILLCCGLAPCAKIDAQGASPRPDAISGKTRQAADPNQPVVAAQPVDATQPAIPPVAVTQPGAPAQPAPANQTVTPNQSAFPDQPIDPATFALGLDDQITIHGSDIDEIAEKPYQVGQDGLVALPMIGTVKAGGLTVREFEVEITRKLAEVIREPHVSVSVTAYGSQPVSVLGSVNTSGVIQLRGIKTLTDVLSMAGGLRPDAGYRAKIVRQSRFGIIPLPGARQEVGTGFSVAEVNLKDILAAKNPEFNIQIRPHDVITIPRAEMVYVIGEVSRAGGFVLNDNQSYTILQALALAGGLRTAAAPARARIIHQTTDKSPDEVPVDVKKILAGKAKDVPLAADDTLFIPLSGAKVAGIEAARAAISVATGIAVFRP